MIIPALMPARIDHLETAVALEIRNYPCYAPLPGRVDIYDLEGIHQLILDYRRLLQAIRQLENRQLEASQQLERIARSLG